MALEALEYFSALGIEVLEGWAIAETAGVGTINRRGAVRHGTVGTAVPGVELRLAGDGELLVRGPSVMAGYRGEPERTAEVLGDDGWLRTGHVAEISGDGYVTIVDRGHSEQIEAMYAVHA
jgi:long-subunit acyl-CoA synthetase (AMP-forming)